MSALMTSNIKYKLTGGKKKPKKLLENQGNTKVKNDKDYERGC